MDAGYYTTRSRSTRAASAHHTEAGAKRETPYGIYYDTDKPRLFDKDDTVMVIDDDCIHVGAVGHIYELMPGNKYMVRFNWSQSAIAGFHERQLRKIDDRKKHRKKKSKKRKLYFDADKVDVFTCAWGTCEVGWHPEIPERWAARHIPSEGVIIAPPPPVVALLPERCATTIAHDQFQKFMGLLRLMDAIDELPITEQQEPLGILDTIMAQEDAKAALKASQPRIRATPRRAAHKQVSTPPQSHKRAMPPKFRVRKVAA